MKRYLVFMLSLCAALHAPFVRGEGVATRLDVNSQPSGAVVYVDGCDCGVTPVSLFDMAPGRHHLRCRLSGYQQSDRFFVLEEGCPLTYDERLEPEYGLLLIKSIPDGANIAVDGVSIGTTPRLVTTLTTKDVHHVTLRKAGYRPSVFDVRFSGRKPLVRTETLVLDSGTIRIMTEPAGAEVMVNGIVRGKSPMEVKDVPRGRAVVRLRLDGFSEETHELSVLAGDSQTLTVAMKGLSGMLGLTSLPPGARFYVNDQYVGTSPVTLSKLAPGAYDVRAEVEGFAPLTRTVTISNGTVAREEFRLSNVTGRLEVRTSPVGAQVLLDGRVAGVTRTNDPQAEFSDVLPIENLMEGEHVLTIRCEGCAESVRHPKIRTGKTSQANVRLKRVLVPDVRITTESGVYEGRLISNNIHADYVEIEVTLGTCRPFPRNVIRKIEFLKGKGK